MFHHVGLLVNEPPGHGRCSLTSHPTTDIALEHVLKLVTLPPPACMVQSEGGKAKPYSRGILVYTRTVFYTAITSGRYHPTIVEFARVRRGRS